MVNQVDVNLTVKETDDAKEPLQQQPEVDKAKPEGNPVLTTMVLLGLAAFSISATQGLAWYSNHTTHFSPFSAGQIAVVMTIVFFWSVWCFVHISSAILAMQCPSFWQGVKLQRLRFISDEDLKYVSAAAEFGVLLMYFFVCDRTDFVAHSEKHYDRDQYWFIWLALVGAGCFTIKRIHHVPASGHIMPLQRDQTEEWKGWMQVQFLMYHYFNATEYYNAIRCYIAAYVWMTGFGNFSFYYVKRDFSLQRFCGMQWRLNFFVFWCCLLLQNDYMLYYICMLHTTFTVFIYACLGVFQPLNYTNTGIVAKLVVLLAIVLVIWDIPGVFDVVWAPLGFLVNYNGKLHEWAFRSKLDHLIWIPGMITAFFHPNSDSFLEWLDTKPFVVQYGIKSAIVAICLTIGYFWYVDVFALGKFDYNKLHPFTSFIPITLYMILRNISHRLRQYHMGLFAWLGKVTLETYICQFHIWMSTAGPNGNPKKLLRFLPPQYPLLNFALVSLLYVYVSHRVFNITTTLKNCAVPSGKDGVAKLHSNLVTWPLTAICVYLLAFIMKMLV